MVVSSAFSRGDSCKNHLEKSASNSQRVNPCLSVALFVAMIPTGIVAIKTANDTQKKGENSGMKL